MDTLQLVRFPYFGQVEQTVLDLNNGWSHSLVRDTFKITPPVKNQQFSQSQQTYGGATLANETHDNGQIEAACYINGPSSDIALGYMETLLSTLENFEGLYVKWQPEGATYPVFYEVRANMPYEFLYRWVEFQGTKTLQVKWAVAVAPLAEGYPMAGRETFLDLPKTWSGGSALNGEFTLTAGAAATTASTETTRNYNYKDVWLEGSVNMQNVADGGEVRFILKQGLEYPIWTPYSIYISLKRVGTEVQLSTVRNGTGSTPVVVKASGDPNWWVSVRGMVYGHRAYSTGTGNLAAQPALPTPQDYPALSGTVYGLNAYNVGSLSDSMSATTIGIEVVGSPSAGSTAKFGALSWGPVTRGDLPATETEAQELGGNYIVGTAPAKLTIYRPPSSRFGLCSWWPHTWNYAANRFSFNRGNGNLFLCPYAGGASDSLPLKNLAFGAPYNTVAATTAIIVSESGGDRRERITFQATDKAGVYAIIPGQFLPGETYTLSAETTNQSGSCPLRLEVGNASGTSTGGVNFTSGAAATTVYSVAEAHSYAVVCLRTTSAAGATVNVSDLRLVKNASVLSPADNTPEAGYAPFGALPAAGASYSRYTLAYPNAAPEVGSAPAAVTYLRPSTTSPHGVGARITNGSSSESREATLGWLIDLSVLPADWGPNDVQCTVYAHCSNSTDFAADVALRTNPLAGSSYGPLTYSSTGSTGVAGFAGLKPIGVLNINKPQGAWSPSVGVELRLVLGPSAVVDLNAVMLLPNRWTISSPQAIPYTASGFPDFTGTDVLRADGSALAAGYPTHALGGAMQTIPPGPAQFVALGVKADHSLAAHTGLQIIPTPRYFIGRGNA